MLTTETRTLAVPDEAIADADEAFRCTRLANAGDPIEEDGCAALGTRLSDDGRWFCPDHLPVWDAVFVIC